MQTKKGPVTAVASIGLLLVLAGSLLTVAECDGASQNTQSPLAQAEAKPGGPDVKANPAAALTDIRFSFKLDSRLLGGTYGGVPWVSPTTYVGANAQDTVEAKAQAVDAQGKPVRINPAWIPAAPDMVAVWPGQGEMVKITVKRPGQSKLTVTAQGFSKELLIKAKAVGKAIQLEISQ